MENNELIKEISRLRDLLTKHGICEDCGELYNHHTNEPFASCGCKQSEWYELTPHMQQVSELKAERDALAAQAYEQKHFIKSVMANIGAGATLDEVVDMLCNWWDSYKLPQQCLLDMQAEAVMGFIEFNAGRYTNHFDACLSDALKTYLAQVQQGGAE